MTDPYLTPEDRAPQELIESVRAQIDVTKKSLKDEFIKPDRIMSNIYVADAEALVAALQASEERERRKDEALREIASFPKTHTPDETEGYALIGTRDQIIQIARTAVHGDGGEW